MNAKYTKSFRNLSFATFFILFVANASLLANSGNSSSATTMSREETISIAAKGLSNKLQSDLASKKVDVKFTKAERYVISDSQIGLRGEGTCRLDGEANDLPVNFDVKIDVSKHSASDVKYVFLNMGAADGAASAVTAEDVITEKLLQKIKSDYKTENVVVAIDYVENQKTDGGEPAFTGGGEVRANGMVWKKISFEARGSKENVSIVKYQIH